MNFSLDFVKMSYRNRYRTWNRLSPYNIRTKSSDRRRETSQTMDQETKYHSSSSSSVSAATCSGERGWDYLLRRKAENINDRIHKAKAAGVGGTTEEFTQFVRIKEEPDSPRRNESNLYLLSSQVTPPFQEMDASQSYAANEGFWIDTTGERYREQNETQQTYSRFVHSQERPGDHYFKTEAPWSYPDPVVESYGVLHSSEDTEQSYWINSRANQLSDQTLTQSLPNDRKDERCDTKQGSRGNIIRDSLSVQMLVANIRNAVATNPNFKRSKHDSATNQMLGHIDDASCASKQSFGGNNLANHLSEQTSSHHVSSDRKRFQHFTKLDPERNRVDSGTNQTLSCNIPNDGKDVSHAAKQGSNRNKQNSLSNKTLIHSLPYPAEGVEVVYTVDPVEAEAWLRNNIIDCSAQAVGFDIEWKPQFVSKKKGGVENKTAVMQLGVENSCLVLQLCNMKSPPKLLRSILNDKKILKVGSGILQDVTKLRRDTGMVIQGMVDTQKMAKSMGPNAPQKLGLKSLAEHFLGINLEKPKYVSRSNWEKYPLTIRQIHYAALDAWIGFKIYQHIKLANGQDQTHIDETQLVDDEAEEKSGGIVSCHVCRKKFKSKDALSNHIKIHAQCKCGKFFQVKISKRHRKICPELNPVTPLVQADDNNIVCCHACGKRLKSAEKLMVHIKEKGHVQCPFCSRLLNGPQCTSHIRRCKQFSEQWIQH